MVRLTDHPECRRASHDRATPSVELPCCAAASSPAAQTSMSACARRASACAKRPNQSAHTLALYPTCRGSRTGTSRGCTGFAPGVGHRWPWHGATGTESEIWRVGNQHGTCARRMVALGRLPSGLSSQLGHVRRKAPAARSTVRLTWPGEPKGATGIFTGTGLKKWGFWMTKTDFNTKKSCRLSRFQDCHVPLLLKFDIELV